MIIHVSASCGEGTTLLSAFDEALHKSGVYNFNLIYLSSIIPTNSVVQLSKIQARPNEYGNRLYVVKSELRCDVKDTFIGAALGWYQDKKGKGVFVEHSCSGYTYQDVQYKLKLDVFNSLSDLCTKRRFPFTKRELKMKFSITKVGLKAACVIVVAAFQNEPW